MYIAAVIWTEVAKKIQLGLSKQKLETWFGVEDRKKVSATI